MQHLLEGGGSARFGKGANSPGMWSLECRKEEAFRLEPLDCVPPCSEFQRIWFSKGLEEKKAGRIYNIPETSIRTA